MNEINHRIKASEDINFRCVTIMRRDDGNYAIPGGGYVTNKGYAEKIAKRLAMNHAGIKSPIAELAKKTVARLEYSMREDRAVMGA